MPSGPLDVSSSIPFLLSFAGCSLRTYWLNGVKMPLATWAGHPSSLGLPIMDVRVNENHRNGNTGAAICVLFVVFLQERGRNGKGKKWEGEEMGPRRVEQKGKPLDWGPVEP